MLIDKEIIMNNNYIVLLDIASQLKRIADSLEESNDLVKEFGGK